MVYGRLLPGMVSTQSPRFPGAGTGYRLRRRPGERNQRPSEGRTGVVRHIRSRIIARCDGKHENERSNQRRPPRGEASPRWRLLLRPIQVSDRRSPPEGRRQHAAAMLSYPVISASDPRVLASFRHPEVRTGELALTPSGRNRYRALAHTSFAGRQASPPVESLPFQ